MSDSDQPTGITRDPSEGPPWAWRFLVRAVVFCLTRIFGWKLSARIEGELPSGGEPVVVVANHTGYLEPFLLAHALWKLTGHWVQPLAKAELFRIPVFGRASTDLVEANGPIFTAWAYAPAGLGARSV